MRTLITQLLLVMALPVCGQARPDNNANRVTKGFTADALIHQWARSWNCDEAAYLEKTALCRMRWCCVAPVPR
jgi:hypothetical protein